MRVGIKGRKKRYLEREREREILVFSALRSYFTLTRGREPGVILPLDDVVVQRCAVTAVFTDEFEGLVAPHVVLESTELLNDALGFLYLWLDGRLIARVGQRIAGLVQAIDSRGQDRRPPLRHRFVGK